MPIDLGMSPAQFHVVPSVSEQAGHENNEEMYQHCLGWALPTPFGHSFFKKNKLFLCILELLVCHFSAPKLNSDWDILSGRHMMQSV